MSVAERIQGSWASAMQSYEALSEREQRMILALGVVAIALFVLVPMYLVVDSIAATEAENTAIREVLREIEQSRTTLRTRSAEREAARARYATRAPALGSFLESKAQAADLALREVTNEPDQVLGSFTRRRVRATFQNVELPKIMRLLETIVNSEHPVSIEKIEIDHPRGSETYTLRIGVNAYDRNQREPSGERSGNEGSASSMSSSSMATSSMQGGQ